MLHLQDIILYLKIAKQFSSHGVHLSKYQKKDYECALWSGGKMFTITTMNFII